MSKRALTLLLVAAAGAVGGIAQTQQASALTPTVYNTPGYHNVNGRYWHTTCSMYSSTIVRCSTDIWGTKPVLYNGTYYSKEGWVFNNQTYLPADRASWGTNNLAKTTSWTDSAGRAWQTECDTATTGANACRTYLTTKTLVNEGGTWVTKSLRVLNSIQQFSTSTLPAQTSIPAAAPAISGVPVEQPFVPPMTPTLYNTPGSHYVNGRWWQTSCAMYSTEIVRCTTKLWGTKIVSSGGKYYLHSGWVFNNLTYLPAPKAMWGSNPLANTGTWTTNGRQWKTECTSSMCRSYVYTTFVVYSNGAFVTKSYWALNSQVQFSSASVAHQKTIPASAPAVSGVPVEKTFVPPAAATYNFKADARCMTGRAMCVSKAQRKLAWMINGQVYKVIDVRFGSEYTPTREGAFTVYRKSRDHISSIYNTPMPFAMFFSGGQAVHYSADFAARGYAGASHGCVNVRDRAAITWLFDTQVRLGDKVIVY